MLYKINQLIRDSKIKRREFILDDMAVLFQKKINCMQCQGPCCTFEANSMQITPLEAIEIINFLKENNKINSDLILNINENIAEYRLDSLPGTGKISLRKTYTCPFFDTQKRRCTISRSAKPIGCLGFNPVEPNIKNGGSCKSNVVLLQKREAEFHEQELEINTQIKKELKLFWDKAPIPVAVLIILEALEYK